MVVAWHCMAGMVRHVSPHGIAECGRRHASQAWHGIGTLPTAPTSFRTPLPRSSSVLGEASR